VDLRRKYQNPSGILTSVLLLSIRSLIFCLLELKKGTCQSSTVEELLVLHNLTSDNALQEHIIKHEWDMVRIVSSVDKEKWSKISTGTAFSFLKVYIGLETSMNFYDTI